MALMLRPPTEIRTLPDQLLDFGKTRQNIEVFAGFCRLLSVILLGLMLLVGLDYLVNCPSGIRAVGLFTFSCYLIYVFVQKILRPYRRSVHALGVAMEIEEKYPRLNDSLASAVDFWDRPEDSRFGSVRFRKIAMIRAQNSLERYNLDSLIPTRQTWLKFWQALLLTVLIVPLYGIFWDTTHVGLLRLINPYGNHPWPTDTQVRFADDNPPTRIAQDMGLLLPIQITGIIPPTITVKLELENIGPAEHQFELPESQSASGVVVFPLKLEADLIPTNFRVQVIANDGITPWHSVTVAPAPRLTLLNDRPSPQLFVEFANYTSLPPVQRPDGDSQIQSVHGCRVKFRAATDRPISSAWLVPKTDRADYQTVASVASLTNWNPLGALAAQSLADDVYQDIPVEIVGSQRMELRADFTPHLPGLYTLFFEDESGLVGQRIFQFQLRPDPIPPSVTLDIGDAKTEKLLLLPTSKLTLHLSAEDRIFGPKQLDFEYRIGNISQPFRHMPMVDLANMPTPLGALGSGLTLAWPTRPVTLMQTATIAVQDLRKLDGSSPKDGDTITLRAAAYDWDDVSVLKPPGRSREIEIRIVGKTSLDTVLQEELAKLRPEIFKLREKQRQAREKVEASREALTNPATAPQELARLNLAEREQQEIRNKVVDERDGLQTKAAKILETIRANELPRTATTDRANVISEELDRLAEEALDSTERQLGDAKSKVQDKLSPAQASPKEADLALGKTVRQQRQIEQSLDEILKQLDQWGGASEVHSQAKQMQDMLKSANETAQKAAKDIPAGKMPADLTPVEKSQLNQAAENLSQLAERAESLLGKTEQLAQDKQNQADQLQAQAQAARDQADQAATKAKQQEAGSEAAKDAQLEADLLRKKAKDFEEQANQAAKEAQALRDAVQAAGGQSLPNNLKDSATNLQENNTAQSSDSRQAAAKQLAAMADTLKEKSANLEVELEKKKNLANELNDIANQQDELAKKAKASENIPDPQAKEQELQRLAREQERLQQRTEDLLQRLTRERNTEASEQVRNALDQMQAAEEKLKQNQTPTEEQIEAVNKLDQAVDKLDQQTVEQQEQLEEEKREQLQTRLKAFRERIAATDAEAERIQAAILKQQGWDRIKLGSLGDLEARATAIADEFGEFARKEMEPYPVFLKLSEQAETQLRRAAELFLDRQSDVANNIGNPFEADIETLADQRTRRPLKTALRRLDILLKALDEAKAKPAEPKPEGTEPPPEDPMPNPDENPMPKPKGQPGIPPLTQLKALREVQAELNERTQEFDKQHPDKTDLDDYDQAEIQDLQRSQREVAELLKQLAEQFRTTETPEEDQ